MHFPSRPAFLAALPGLTVMLSPAAHAEGGMPQLHFTDWLMKGQVFWGAVIFFAFYLILRSFSLPQVGSVLDKRAQRISDDLSLAHKSKDEADEADASLKEIRAKTRADIQAQMQKIKQEVHETTTRLAQETHVRLQGELQKAQSLLQQEQEAARADIQHIAAPVALYIIERLLPSHLPERSSHLQRQIEHYLSALHANAEGAKSEDAFAASQGEGQ